MIVAERLMENLLELTQPMNLVAITIEQITDEEERRKLKYALGSVMGYVYTDLMDPIVKQYPDLDPDK